MKRALLLALCLTAGCRFGLTMGAARRDYENKTIVNVEGGGYKKSGFGGFVVLGTLPNGKEDNDSVHNNDFPWLIADGRYRRPFLDISSGSRLYAAGALGAGLCLRGVITEAQLELGVEVYSKAERPTSLDLSLRYAPLYIVGDDGPTYALMVGAAVGKIP